MINYIERLTDEIKMSKILGHPKIKIQMLQQELDRAIDHDMSDIQ